MELCLEHDSGKLYTQLIILYDNTFLHMTSIFLFLLKIYLPKICHSE